MGSVYKERYGISSENVTHLIRRFYRYFRDSDWQNADDFVRWCSENGWQKECTRVAYGCEEYRAWFVKNWNQNIHVPPVKPVVEEGRKVFRYEAPDLVREGIVWTGN